MKLSQIDCFTSVVENQFSISRAAQRKFIAQSALSRQLQILESDLGLPLFVRQGKRLLQLTQFGESIYEEAKQLQLHRDNLRQMALDWKNQRQVITIATTHTQAKYFLPQVFSQLRKKLPKVQICIEQSNPSELVNLLEQKKADIAVCTESISHQSNLTYEPCYQWEHILIVPKKHSLAYLENVHIKQLKGLPIVTYVWGFTGRSTIQQAFSEAGFEPNVVFSAADTDVIKTYVRLGFGVGIIARMAFEDGDGKDLVVKEIYPKFEPNRTGVAWLKNSYQTKEQKVIIESLLEQGKQMKAL